MADVRDLIPDPEANLEALRKEAADLFDGCRNYLDTNENMIEAQDLKKFKAKLEELKAKQTKAGLEALTEEKLEQYNKDIIELQARIEGAVVASNKDSSPSILEGKRKLLDRLVEEVGKIGKEKLGSNLNNEIMRGSIALGMTDKDMISAARSPVHESIKQVSEAIMRISRELKKQGLPLPEVAPLASDAAPAVKSDRESAQAARPEVVQPQANGSEALNAGQNRDELERVRKADEPSASAASAPPSPGPQDSVAVQAAPSVPVSAAKKQYSQSAKLKSELTHLVEDITARAANTQEGEFLKKIFRLIRVDNIEPIDRNKLMENVQLLNKILGPPGHRREPAILSGTSMRLLEQYQQYLVNLAHYQLLDDIIAKNGKGPLSDVERDLERNAIRGLLLNLKEGDQFALKDRSGKSFVVEGSLNDADKVVLIEGLRQRRLANNSDVPPHLDILKAIHDGNLSSAAISTNAEKIRSEIVTEFKIIQPEAPGGYIPPVVTPVVDERAPAEDIFKKLVKQITTGNIEGKATLYDQLEYYCNSDPAKYLNMKGEAGATLLHYLVISDNLPDRDEMVALLIKLGADPTKIDQAGRSPIDYAFAKNNGDLHKAIENGIQEHKRIYVMNQDAGERAVAPWKEAVEKAKKENKQAVSAEHPQLAVVEQRKDEPPAADVIFKKLVDQIAEGITVSEKDTNLYNQLEYFCNTAPATHPNMADLNGSTLLHHVVNSDKLSKTERNKMVILLIRLGADPTITDGNVKSPIDYAIEKQDGMLIEAIQKGIAERRRTFVGIQSKDGLEAVETWGKILAKKENVQAVLPNDLKAEVDKLLESPENTRRMLKEFSKSSDKQDYLSIASIARDIKAVFVGNKREEQYYNQYKVVRELALRTAMPNDPNYALIAEARYLMAKADGNLLAPQPLIKKKDDGKPQTPDQEADKKIETAFSTWQSMALEYNHPVVLLEVALSKATKDAENKSPGSRESAAALFVRLLKLDPNPAVDKDGNVLKAQKEALKYLQKHAEFRKEQALLSPITDAVQKLAKYDPQFASQAAREKRLLDRLRLMHSSSGTKPLDEQNPGLESFKRKPTKS